MTHIDRQLAGLSFFSAEASFNPDLADAYRHLAWAVSCRDDWLRFGWDEMYEESMRAQKAAYEAFIHLYRVALSCDAGEEGSHEARRIAIGCMVRAREWAPEMALCIPISYELAAFGPYEPAYLRSVHQDFFRSSERFGRRELYVAILVATVLVAALFAALPL